MIQHFFPSNTPATYFAVEQKKGENLNDVAQAVLVTASEAGIQFKYLEANGPLVIGGMTFIRFRIDRTQAMDLSSELLKRGRGVVWSNGKGFSLQCGSRTGKVPMTRVIVTPCPNDRIMFMGTLGKHWERQFGKPALQPAAAV
jgi:hypothetical protein